MKTTHNLITHLFPDVDRLPLVSSCIIQVSQDIDEPWPVEVISHSGVAYNISMQPGDMALYESHSILHGRPFPLVGRHYVSEMREAAPLTHSLQLLIVFEPRPIFLGEYICALCACRP